MVTQNDDSARGVVLIGRLTFDGEKTLCHLCCKWYIVLGIHVVKAHGWTTADYREEFGLNVYQPLCSPEVSKRCALRPQCLDNHILSLSPFKPGHKLLRKNFTLRAQALRSASECRKGRSLTTLELQALRRNLDKAKRTAYCDYCGLPVAMYRDKNVGEILSCPNCRKRKKAEYQRLRRQSRARNHLCVVCGVPTSNGSRCPKHARLHLGVTGSPPGQ